MMMAMDYGCLFVISGLSGLSFVFVCLFVYIGSDIWDGCMDGWMDG
jgi:hypothetical protein